MCKTLCKLKYFVLKEKIIRRKSRRVFIILRNELNETKTLLFHRIFLTFNELLLISF